VFITTTHIIAVKWLCSLQCVYFKPN